MPTTWRTLNWVIACLIPIALAPVYLRLLAVMHLPPASLFGSGIAAAAAFLPGLWAGSMAPSRHEHYPRLSGATALAAGAGTVVGSRYLFMLLSTPSWALIIGLLMAAAFWFGQWMSAAAERDWNAWQERIGRSLAAGSAVDTAVGLLNTHLARQERTTRALLSLGGLIACGLVAAGAITSITGDYIGGTAFALLPILFLLGFRASGARCLTAAMLRSITYPAAAGVLLGSVNGVGFVGWLRSRAVGTIGRLVALNPDQALGSLPLVALVKLARLIASASDKVLPAGDWAATAVALVARIAGYDVAATSQAAQLLLGSRQRNIAEGATRAALQRFVL
ncbi:MAG: hypothetical protein KGJ62_15525 [Armatimonadetes bacterium]|nr:hypothetical protein [Armatimonadota bacterium]MDE2206988.1 hypothetical protein [Armatimonadota bacterium]